MNFITQPDTAHLLSASLESFHEESCRWLEEIDFWQSEMSFFFKLLNKRMPTKTFPSEKLSTMEKKLITIQTSWLDKTKDKIIKHKKALSDLLQNKLSNDEEEFREEHRRILSKVYTIQDLIKDFKREVFSLF